MNKGTREETTSVTQKVFHHGDVNAVCQAWDPLRPLAGFRSGQMSGVYTRLARRFLSPFVITLCKYCGSSPPLCQQRSLTAQSGTAPRPPPSGSVPRGPGPARWREAE